MKKTHNVAPPGRAPMDTPQGVEVGKDPKYRNTERAQNFPHGVQGVAGSSQWSSNSTPDAERGSQGTGSG
jgi:hypothetical protein